MSLHKNVPGWERWARVALGTVALVGGVVWALVGSPVLGGLVAFSGLGLGATGVVGWCPLCAAVGRTLPQTERTISVSKL